MHSASKPVDAQLGKPSSLKHLPSKNYMPATSHRTSAEQAGKKWLTCHDKLSGGGLRCLLPV